MWSLILLLLLSFGGLSSIVAHALKHKSLPVEELARVPTVELTITSLVALLLYMSLYLFFVHMYWAWIMLFAWLLVIELVLFTFVPYEHLSWQVSIVEVVAIGTVMLLLYHMATRIVDNQMIA